jgi:heat shock protein HslJ
MWRLILPLLVCLGCAAPVRLDPAFTAHTWRLLSINQADFPATVTMQVRRTGLVLGRMPCNRFSGNLTRWPLGWEFGRVQVRNAPCPDGHAEAAFIAAVTQATRAEVVGVHLYLRGPDGLVVQFGRDTGRRR